MASRCKRKRYRRRLEAVRGGDRTVPDPNLGFQVEPMGVRGSTRGPRRKVSVEECGHVLAAKDYRHVAEPSGSAWLLVKSTITLPDGEPESFNYSVCLVATVQAIGVVRTWFLCPLVWNGVPCRRRVAKLYLPPGARHFGCRHCHRLTYESRRR